MSEAVTYRLLFAWLRPASCRLPAVVRIDSGRLLVGVCRIPMAAADLEPSPFGNRFLEVWLQSRSID